MSILKCIITPSLKQTFRHSSWSMFFFFFNLCPATLHSELLSECEGEAPPIYFCERIIMAFAMTNDPREQRRGKTPGLSPPAQMWCCRVHLKPRPLMCGPFTLVLMQSSSRKCALQITEWDDMLVKSLSKPRKLCLSV